MESLPKNGGRDIEPTGKMLPGRYVIHQIFVAIVAAYSSTFPALECDFTCSVSALKKGHINYSDHMLSASCNKVTIIIYFFWSRCVLDCRRCQTRRVLCDGVPRGVVEVEVVVVRVWCGAGITFFFRPLHKNKL